MYDSRSRPPTDLNRIPRKRDMAPLVWIMGSIGVGIVVALVVLVVVWLK